MSLVIQEINDQKIWDGFALAYPEKTFLHSWQWGEFNRATGEKIWRLGIYGNEKLLGVALVIKIMAKRGTFLFCPHGPLIDWAHEAHFPLVLEYIKKLAQQEKARFIRVSPLLRHSDTPTPHQTSTSSVGTGQALRHFDLRPAPIHMHAETTWTLDIRLQEEELLTNMRKTTRNLIRRAERESLHVTFGTDEHLVDVFYNLHARTVERQHFVPFARKYILEEIRTFQPDNILVAIADVGGMPNAGAIIPIYGNTGYYHHGASIATRIPAAHFLQWSIIQELKQRGLHFYNFWGIAPTDNPKHPWHGLSQFKMGFGGYRTDYLHAQDLPLSWRYWINYAIEFLRRWKRGF